ncbi:hypothetical protein [Absidia glauca]|uniref:Uncharacterized protein n=1 Tax=Absidia glauca TaxID=4829 RepID=A0A168R1T8_ABSGL|nr:hypothetical protein [Absidia glauca]
MLRINSTRLGQQLQPVWRQSLFAIRHESTSAPASSDEKKPSLSQRLGGSGRGKVMEAGGQNQDVFASFLAQAQKRQQRTRPNNGNSSNNNNKDGKRRPNEGQRAAKPGQFDDAKEDKPVRKFTNNKQRRPQQQAGSETSRNNNSNNNNNNNNRRQGQQKQKRDRKPQQSYNASPSAAARRATTFIAGDIDWLSLGPVESVQQETSSTSETSSPDQQQQLEKSMIAGDYASFLSIGQSIQWPANVDTRGLETLISGNASYGLEAKTTFLATVAKASNVGGGAALKK